MGVLPSSSSGGGGEAKDADKEEDREVILRFFAMWHRWAQGSAAAASMSFLRAARTRGYRRVGKWGLAVAVR